MSRICDLIYNNLYFNVIMSIIIYINDWCTKSYIIKYAVVTINYMIYYVIIAINVFIKYLILRCRYLRIYQLAKSICRCPPVVCTAFIERKINDT